METTANNRKKQQVLSANVKLQIMKYIVVCIFLAIVNWVTSPFYWWVLWVIAGWGINLAMNILSHYILKSEEESI